MLVPMSGIIDLYNLYTSSPHISMGFGIGLRTCRMVEPGSVGLKGAWAPYGRGIGRSASSSGM